MLLQLVINILLLSLFGASSPDTEPVVRARSFTSTIPGEPCTKSVQVCVPHWRSLLEKRGSIQVELRDLHGTDNFHVVINNVVSGGPGDRAGLLIGDHVVAINDIELGAKNHSTVPKILADFKIGEEVTYRILRDGREHSLSALAVKPTPETTNKWIFFCIAETFGFNAARSFAEKHGVQFARGKPKKP